jgi:hypothetical protein
MRFTRAAVVSRREDSMSVKAFVIVIAALAVLAGGAMAIHHRPGASLMKGMRATLHGSGY